jgi:outer membrane protein assembly factor BamB
MERLYFISLVAMMLSCGGGNGDTTAPIEWRNDRTGIYNETGLMKSWPEGGPELLWHYDELGDGFSSIGVSSGKIYITGLLNEKGYLFVFDLNGALLNKVVYGDEWTKNYVGPRATPVINAGKIYLYSGTGNLICLDENSLEVIWKRNVFEDFDSKNITWGVAESPLIIEEKIIITPGGKEHNVVALDKNTGKLIWSSTGEGELSAYCSPLYIGEQETPLIVTITAEHIIGLEASTGKMLWSFESTNEWSIHSNTPVYANDMILYSTVIFGTRMLRLSDGGRKAEIIWENHEVDNERGGMVKIGNYVYGADSNHKTKTWFCVDWETGEIINKQKEFAAIGSSIFADGLLYCYSEKGVMALVNPDPEKFEIISKFNITLGTDQHFAHPVIYNGILFVRHGNSLMAYKIRS